MKNSRMWGKGKRKTPINKIYIKLLNMRNYENVYKRRALTGMNIVIEIQYKK